MSNYSAEEWINRLTSRQRIHMIELNMNPINPKHIQSYLNGKQIKPDMNETIERAKALIGEDNLKKSLGHSRDNAFSDPTPGNEYTPTDTPFQESVRNLNNDPDYIRNNMKQQMDDYATSSGGMTAPELMSFNKPMQQPMNNSNKLNEAVQQGKTLATNYYNAFIKSLQNPNTQSHYAVYKALKTLLEQEKALANSQLLPHYQRSVNEVASQMYNNIKKQLND